MAAAVEEPVLTNISEMIDLAIGTPENGVVDFNMLQTVLHCMAQQLRILGKNVELRGNMGITPIGRPSQNAQTIAISEYIIDTDTPGKFELASGGAAVDPESVLVVERKQRSATSLPVSHDDPRDKKKKKKSTTGKSTGALDTETEEDEKEPPSPRMAASKVAQSQSKVAQSQSKVAQSPSKRDQAVSQSAVLPAQGAPSGKLARPSALSPTSSKEKLSLVTLSKFNVLENAVADLKERVYGTSPKNETILQEVRSQSNLKAITEMWTNMNVASRLDAAEQAIGKLSSLIEDLIGESTALQSKLSTVPGTKTSQVTPAAPSPTMATLAAPSTTAGPGIKPSQIGPSQTGRSQILPSQLGMADTDQLATKDELEQAVGNLATKDELGQVLDYVQSMKGDLETLNETFSGALKEVNPSFVAPDQTPKSRIVISTPQLGDTTSAVSRTQQAASQYPGIMQPPPVPDSAQALQAPPAPPGPQAQLQPAQLSRLSDRMIQLENDMRKCCDGFKKTEGYFRDQFISFQDQLEYMAKQIADSTGLGEGGKLTPDLVKDLQALMKLFETVQSMQVQLKDVHDTAISLAAEKDSRQNHIDALLEQIELLKVIKLDREDMVEALADKADLRMLARKVSHDQFENACDDLSKGLEHALGKLSVQESLWQQALDDIQREIEQKLDRLELSPVKDFFNNKLKQLQENLRQMAALRREAEAAGTKTRLLRDVNCISCDANAVMKMDPAPPQPSKPLPGNLSMKPYLTYELDAIRKTQANALPQRNMHDWEHVQQQMQPHKPHKVRSDTDKHLCNRYCGGSHTTTTPAQRVARLGHFMKQWGPEVLPLSSGFAAGDDGKLYKISTTEGANVGPGGAVDGGVVGTPRSSKKPEPPILLPKSIDIITECRCLDPTAERPPPKN